MNVPNSNRFSLYFCINSSSCEIYSSPEDLLQHLRSKHFIEDQKINRLLVEHHITSFVKYQVRLNDHMSADEIKLPDHSQTLYKGCLVCDKIIELFGIGNNPKFHIKSLAHDYKTNINFHLSAHMQYKSLECEICRVNNERLKFGRVFRTYNKYRMKYHIVHNHRDYFENWTDFDNEDKINSFTNSLYLGELERLIKDIRIKFKIMLKEEKIASKIPPLEELNVDMIEQIIQIPQNSKPSKDITVVDLATSSDEETNQIGCLFCRTTFDIWHKAFDHYVKHFNSFIKCTLCCEKFPSSFRFIEHNFNHNFAGQRIFPENYKSVSEWTIGYFFYITNGKGSAKDHLYDTLSTSCPTCYLFEMSYGKTSKRALDIDEKLHIEEHLKYQKYICTVCDKDGKQFFNPGLQSKRHVVETHGLSESEYENIGFKVFFREEKTRMIYVLEKIIEKSLVKSDKKK